MDNSYEKKILSIKFINNSTFKVRFDRLGIEFQPGQYINIGIPVSDISRDYSIYSSKKKPYFELLLKNKPDDEIATAVSNNEVGDIIKVNTPEGQMIIGEPDDRNQKYLFVATGIGVAPFHSIIQSYPNLNYQLIYGIPYKKDIIDIDDYERNRVKICLSKEKGGDFGGYVTEYLKRTKVQPDMLCYISGIPEMVFEVFQLLIIKGIPRDQIFSDQL